MRMVFSSFETELELTINMYYETKNGFISPAFFNNGLHTAGMQCD